MQRPQQRTWRVCRGKKRRPEQHRCAHCPAQDPPTAAGALYLHRDRWPRLLPEVDLSKRRA